MRASAARAPRLTLTRFERAFDSIRRNRPQVWHEPELGQARTLTLTLTLIPTRCGSSLICCRRRRSVMTPPRRGTLTLTLTLTLTRTRTLTRTPTPTLTLALTLTLT